MGGEPGSDRNPAPFIAITVTACSIPRPRRHLPTTAPDPDIRPRRAPPTQRHTQHVPSERTIASWLVLVPGRRCLAAPILAGGSFCFAVLTRGSCSAPPGQRRESAVGAPADNTAPRLGFRPHWRGHHADTGSAPRWPVRRIPSLSLPVRVMAASSTAARAREEPAAYVDRAGHGRHGTRRSRRIRD